MVQNYQPADTISDPTVVKLLEVDSSLAHQEALLLAQLESIGEKRRSLKIVIDLFGDADTTTTVEESALAVAASNGISVQIQSANWVVDSTESVSPLDETTADAELESSPVFTAPDQTSIVESQPDSTPLKAPSAKKTKQPAAKKTATKTEPTTTEQTLSAEDTQSSKAKSVSSASKTKQPTAAKKTAKTSGRWQDYLREEFSNSALSEAVGQVLQRQPEEVLETAAIIDAIFVDNLTKGVRNTARERIANVLSDGVRKNKWYRAEAGSYSISDFVTDEATPVRLN